MANKDYHKAALLCWIPRTEMREGYWSKSHHVACIKIDCSVDHIDQGNSKKWHPVNISLTFDL